VPPLSSETPVIAATKPNGKANGNGLAKYAQREVMARVTRKRKPEAARRRRSKTLMREHLGLSGVRATPNNTVKNRLVHIGFFYPVGYEHCLREPHEIHAPVLEPISGTCSSTAKKNGDR